MKFSIRLGRTEAAVVVILALIFAACSGAHAQTPSPGNHGLVTAISIDWPVYGGQAEGDHYSSLSQINRKNVQKLQVAWKFDAGEEGGLETSPIIVGRVLYAYTATQKVVALDAASGKLIWKFDSGIVGKIPIRGLSYWTDGNNNDGNNSGNSSNNNNDARIFAAVTNFLYALDAKTGKPIPTFGEEGR